MNVVFYNHAKRNNSTKLPTGGVTIPCSLKDACSVVSPVLEIKTAMRPDYNYAYISDFGRYYYVTEWIYDKGIWSCSLSVDVLTSWLNEIKATQAQVLFSSSLYDLDVIDNRVASIGTYRRKSFTADFVGTLTGQNVTPSGTFAINALSNTSTWATGTTTAYFMTYQQMQLFARELVTPSVWEGLKQFFNNPMDGITECYYIPLDISKFIDLTVDGAVQIGDYTFPTATAKKAISTNFALTSYTTSIDIPWLYDDFRRLAPYTELTMFVPFCGAKPINPEMVYDIDKLFIDYSVDIVTGNIQAIVYNKEELLEEFSGNCKITLPVGQTQSRVESVIGATGGAITAIAGFASGNVALGATGVLSAISSVITPASVKTTGGMSGTILGAILGNDLMRWQKFRLSATSRDTADEPENMRAVVGNALNKVTTLSDLTGYVQCYGASVNASATIGEITSINDYLNSGIYIE